MQVRCSMCSGVVNVPILGVDFDRWRNGELIQVAAPYLTAGERELLATGTCDQCFESLFASEDECNGICLTPGDIGIHGTGVDVAYAHPDCPEHGG